MAKLYALAHPAITFTLIEGGRTVFRSPACDSPADRVREIFGRAFAESLAPINSGGQRFAVVRSFGEARTKSIHPVRR